jgi:hypothetical protein
MTFVSLAAISNQVGRDSLGRGILSLACSERLKGNPALEALNPPFTRLCFVSVLKY